jgi:hypothetical protein
MCSAAVGVWGRATAVVGVDGRGGIVTEVPNPPVLSMAKLSRAASRVLQASSLLFFSSLNWALVCILWCKGIGHRAALSSRLSDYSVPAPGRPLNSPLF